MQAATTSPPRRRKPRRVIYKSTALEKTAPQLVAAASAEVVSAARSIQKAHAAAETVRCAYKETREDVGLGVVISGDDQTSNAQKYERRLKMNRQSAAASRVRREAYTKALEAQLVEMEGAYKSIFLQLELLQQRNQELEMKQHAFEIQGPSVQHTHAQDPNADEIEPNVKEEEPKNPVDSFNFEHFDLDFCGVEEDDKELANVLQDFAGNTYPGKTESFLVDDPVVAHNDEFQVAPVPETMPECFESCPTEDDCLVNNFL